MLLTDIYFLAKDDEQDERDLIWFIGVLTLINFALNMYTIKMARVLEGNTTQHSTIADIASGDNRRNSSVSMGTGMEN